MNQHPAVVERLGQGPDLVLCHGWAMHSGIWGGAIEQLAAHFSLHLVDLPGHGRNREAWPEDWQAWNDGLQAVIPSGAWWMGWSLGGLFALDQALRHSQQVSGVILVASNPCFVRNEHWQYAMEESVFTQFADDLAQDYRSALSRFLALEVHGSDHARQALRELNDCAFAHGEPELQALQGGLSLLREVDLSAHLDQLNRPLLTVGGRRDRLVPPKALTATAAQAAWGRAEIIAGAGHAPFIGHRDEFVELVREFIA